VYNVQFCGVEIIIDLVVVCAHQNDKKGQGDKC
jgi:hypothetical protein